MAKPKKRKKLLIFGILFLVLGGLTAVALLKKRDVVVTVQTDKVTRRNMTEIVPSNGRIQPVLQVKISAEVSGEITDLPIKEGQAVKKGDLLVKIKPDFYLAQMHQCQASYESSLAGKSTAEANLRKAEAEFKRNQDLYKQKLISDSTFDEVRATYDVARAQVDAAGDQVEMSKASVDSAKDSLDKTTILAPLDGTISKLNSRLGERVLGTIQNVGTEIMTISDLNEMEARVDVGENDVVLIKPGQKAKLEVDAFKNRKFNGIVTEIANSSNDAGQIVSSSSQEATKFQVKIRIQEKEDFRPGMSVTADIETRYRTNVLTVPFASITTRMPKEKEKKPESKYGHHGTNAPAASTNKPAGGTNMHDFTFVTNAVEQPAADGTNTGSLTSTNSTGSDTNSVKKGKEAQKAMDVVFVVEGDHVKMVPVKFGISDDDYWEITDGLKEGQEVVSGSYRAINRDLEDGKKVRKGTPPKEDEKPK